MLFEHKFVFLSFGPHTSMCVLNICRSMRIKTPTVAKKPIAKADQCLTPIGSLLRKASVNELLVSQKFA